MLWQKERTNDFEMKIHSIERFKDLNKFVKVPSKPDLRRSGFVLDYQYLSIRYRRTEEALSNEVSNLGGRKPTAVHLCIVQSVGASRYRCQCLIMIYAFYLANYCRLAVC